MPEHFATPDPEALLATLVPTTLPHLVTITDDGLVATPVPMLYDAEPGEHGALVGHLARANPQWRTTAAETEAMVLVLGADAYVSPTLYPSRADDPRVVPTWNYEAVHAWGSFVVHDDPDWKLALLRRLTDAHEARRPDPWSIDDAAEGHVADRLRGIVGFEVTITRVIAKQKLSQNRPAVDRAFVADELEQGESAARAVSVAMRALEP
ncbi:MAG TPA: FMN-binding negative transcriptional regulator [Acidimicrobiales bacterium]|nr:FMN-binding negative transcriptional regulator [Acidimicrobiales bacterium]